MKEFLRAGDRIFEDILHALFGNDLLFLLMKGLFETIYMVGFSIVFAVIFGLPLGVLLTLTRADSIKPMPLLNKTLGWVVNTIRSIAYFPLSHRH